MFIEPQQYNERLRTCRACPFYENGWCGTPVVGTLVDNPKGGRRKRTCGCNMKVKAAIPWMECGHPFEKRWGKVMDYPAEMIAEMKEFAGSIGDRITSDQKERLFTYLEKLTGANYKNKQTTCVPCLTEALKKLRTELKKYDKGLDT